MTAKPVPGVALSLAHVEPARPFDPAESAFVAQQRRPAHLSPVNMADLTPFQRGLLVADGTVTRFVEAYWLEPVVVMRLAQSEATLTTADDWLELDAGAPVIRRRVVLFGRQTGRFFAWADSVMATQRLQPAVRSALDLEGGLGRILLDTAMETRREGLWYGRERPPDAPAEVVARWPGEFLTRTYRVLASGRPIMVITERFAL